MYIVLFLIHTIFRIHSLFHCVIGADWENYKILHNECTNCIRNAKSSYSKDLVSENLQNPRKFWKVMKELIPMKPKSSTNAADSLENNENVTATSCKEKANLFCDFFLECC